MTRTISIQVDVPLDRRLLIPVPQDVPVGPAQVIIITRLDQKVPAGTATEMISSPLFGLWARRDDIGDSLAYARQLRAQAERRDNG